SLSSPLSVTPRSLLLPAHPTLLLLLLLPLPATTETYTLSLHDALPISSRRLHAISRHALAARSRPGRFASNSVRRARSERRRGSDRKSTRLNSSHVKISYAVFCLKKKNCMPCRPCLMFMLIYITNFCAC